MNTTQQIVRIGRYKFVLRTSPCQNHCVEMWLIYMSSNFGYKNRNYRYGLNQLI